MGSVAEIVSDATYDNAVHVLRTAASVCVRHNLLKYFLTRHCRLAWLVEAYREHAAQTKWETVANAWAADYAKVLNEYNKRLDEWLYMSRTTWLVQKRKRKKKLKELDGRLDALEKELERITVELAIIRRSRHCATVLSNRTCEGQSMSVESHGVKYLLSHVIDGTETERYAALCQLHILSARETHKRKMVEAGAIGRLVSLVREGTENEKIEAIATMRSLALANTRVKAAVAQQGGIEAIIDVVHNGSERLRVQAVAVVESQL